MIIEHEITINNAGVTGHIKSIPIQAPLPSATSADEGKVLMINSNGEYVLGTVASGYIVDFSIDDFEVSQTSEEE